MLMNIGLTTQYIIVAVVILVAAWLLRIIRTRLATRSLLLAGVVAVLVAMLFGQVAAWYVAALRTPHIPIVLMSAFIGMMSVQPRVISVISLCRSLALVSAMIAVWVTNSASIPIVTVFVLATAVLMCVAYLAGRRSDTSSGESKNI